MIEMMKVKSFILDKAFMDPRSLEYEVGTF